jgi:hypothetical protein
MSVSQFKDINWGPNEFLARDKLNTMVSNTRYLYEQQPKLYYNAYNVKRSAGVKIAAGTNIVAANKGNYHEQNINFGSFFTVGIASPHNRRIIPTFWGFSGKGYVPDHRGLVVCIATSDLSKTHYLKKKVYLNWIAFGY